MLMLLEYETHRQFGYFPSELHPGSNKSVLYVCPRCGEINKTRRSRYYEKRLCHSCGAKQSIEKNRHPTAGTEALRRTRETYAALGLTVAGDKLLTDKERREKRRQYKTSKYYNDLLFNLKKRLGSSLLQAKNKVGTRAYGVFRLLPYTAEELKGHIQERLIYHNHQCPMCGESLEPGFDIDHVIPLKTAKTLEGILALFALSNLDTLCHRCNCFVKKDRSIRY